MKLLSLLVLHSYLIDAVCGTTLDKRDSTFTSVVTVTVTAQPTQTTATASSSSSSTSSSSSSSLSSSSFTNSTQLQHDALNLTNSYRQQHNASALTWNKTLTVYAQNWADRCLWKHSGGPNGENLAEGFTNTTSAIAAWGRESKDYDYSKPTGFSESTGHFTQLVWKATTQVGCAVANCSKNDDTFRENGKEAFGWFFVCEYWPPGNVVGDKNRYFEENVDPVVSRAARISHKRGMVGLWWLVVLIAGIVLF